MLQLYELSLTATRHSLVCKNMSSEKALWAKSALKVSVFTENVLNINVDFSETLKIY